MGGWPGRAPDGLRTAAARKARADTPPSAGTKATPPLILLSYKGAQAPLRSPLLRCRSVVDQIALLLLVPLALSVAAFPRSHSPTLFDETNEGGCQDGN